MPLISFEELIKHEIKVIDQLKDGLCGQACVAMITGLPLEIVIDQFGHAKKSGTHIREIAMHLRWFGWDSEVVGDKNVSVLPDFCILQFKVLGTNKRHVVVYKNGWIYDSGCPGGVVLPYSKETLKFLRYKPLSFLKINT